MSTTSPPPVVHHIRCICARCCAERAAEARRRIEEARLEERRGCELAYLEANGGVVFARLGLTKARTGTAAALRRLGGSR